MSISAMFVVCLNAAVTNVICPTAAPPIYCTRSSLSDQTADIYTRKIFAVTYSAYL